MTSFDRERQFQLLLDAVADYAIYMLDPKGCVISWNAAAEQIKGYRLEEVEGQSFARFFTPEDRGGGVPEKILEHARTHGKTESEGWRVRKDGSRFWALATLHAMRNDQGELIGFAKITRDMTERRAASEALLEAERRFRYLVEGVVDYAIYMLDANGVITNWNRGAERIKGYRAEEVIGRHFSIFYGPEDRAAGIPARALKQALKEGRFEAEGWRVRKDGTRFWANVVIDAIHDDQGRHIGFAKVTRDTTESREAHQALMQSERQFRLLVSGVVDYSIFMIDPNGIITNWNAGAQHIKGYTPEEAIGQHISIFYTDQDRAAGRPMRALQIAAEKGRYEAEAWRVRKDGSLFWASVVLDAIRDESGELVGFAKITRDITERRNAQIELQHAHEQLAQSQKMEAIGQLTGGVAHDFNNLLMVVLGQAQLLRKRVQEEPRALRALDAIETAAKRGTDLTRHLLAFARRQRLSPSPILLADRAKVIRELLAASLGSIVRLSVEVEEDVWPVRIDPGEFDLALINMAVNARDAMPEGGDLIISASSRTLGPGEVADLVGDFVALTVRDTGFGIPEDIVKRVFDPFFTTKPVDKGTGLGLSQVYGFLQQSGGHITVDSKLGSGTTFTLYFPRAEANASASEEAPEVESQGGAYILVVEDNPEVSEVAAGLLEQLGNRVRPVPNAELALAALEEETFDLVFSDIVMAGEMDGLALARRIRQLYPTMPVVLATGYAQSAERLGGEFPILRKPYQLTGLSRAIGSALANPPDGDGNGNGDGRAKVVHLDQARRANGGRKS